MEKNCSICGKAVDTEKAAILTMGGFGNPRYMCDGCRDDFDAATLGRDPEEISEAISRVGKKMTTLGVDDKYVLKTVEEIISAAHERKAKIEDGSYDFSQDENNEEAAEENDVPEELRESEEDIEAERIEAEKTKKFDKITNWICFVIFLAALGYIAYRLISMYF